MVFISLGGQTDYTIITGIAQFHNCNHVFATKAASRASLSVLKTIHGQARSASTQGKCASDYGKSA